MGAEGMGWGGEVGMSGGGEGVEGDGGGGSTGLGGSVGWRCVVAVGEGMAGTGAERGKGRKAVVGGWVGLSCFH